MDRQAPRGGGCHAARWLTRLIARKETDTVKIVWHDGIIVGVIERGADARWAAYVSIAHRIGLFDTEKAASDAVIAYRTRA